MNLCISLYLLIYVHTNFPAAYLPNGTFSQHNLRINVQSSLVSSLVLQKSLKSSDIFRVYISPTDYSALIHEESFIYFSNTFCWEKMTLWRMYSYASNAPYLLTNTYVLTNTYILNLDAWRVRRWLWLANKSWKIASHPRPPNSSVFELSLHSSVFELSSRYSRIR